jgi:hypothetical protein
MSTLRFFLPPTVFFEIIRDVRAKLPFHVIFRRFATADFAATLTVVAIDDSLERTYLTGGYSEMMLSLDATPNSATDWEFTSRVAEQLIIVEGGRVSGRVLELSRLRIFAKKSRAQGLYKALRKQITGRCVKSVHARNTTYDDIYYAGEAALQYHLRLSLAPNAPEFVPTGIEPTGPARS